MILDPENFNKELILYINKYDKVNEKEDHTIDPLSTNSGKKFIPFMICKLEVNKAASWRHRFISLRSHKILFSL